MAFVSKPEGECDGGGCIHGATIYVQALTGGDAPVNDLGTHATPRHQRESGYELGGGALTHVAAPGIPAPRDGGH